MTDVVEVDLARGVEVRRTLTAKEEADFKKQQATARAETQAADAAAQGVEKRLAALEAKVK